ncbi:MAG: tyrosine-type recombinase/integrase, partial [Paracoccaceae bacterium]|nr:tyrosine-type recombinase/integrase [Paracoccaceae bacterium]
ARRKISAPAEVLPCWRAGIEAEVSNPAIRDALWFGLYTGMRRDEVLTLRWGRVDMDALTFPVEETKTGVPLELPITNQLAAILKRRRLDHRPASRARSEDRRSDRGVDVSGGIIRDCRCLGLSTETHHRSSGASIRTTVDNGIPTV